MFCTKCGKEIQEEWKNCPNCGNVLREEAVDEQNSNVDVMAHKMRSRDEIKAELLNGIFSGEEKGAVILFYGAGSISKDMANILNPGEDMLAFHHAHRCSLIGQLKSLRMFRNYIVFTNQRILYIERGSMAFSLIPFTKKTVSLPYHEILNVTSDKRFGIYSGKIKIEYMKKTLKLAVMNLKSAEEMGTFLMSKE